MGQARNSATPASTAPAGAKPARSSSAPEQVDIRRQLFGVRFVPISEVASIASFDHLGQTSHLFKREGRRDQLRF
jgi:hypothetical protein